MRNAFIEELVKAASVNEKIVLVVGDLGYGVVEPFVSQFPKRFFNAGVAEQNMMGLSAGLASEGFHVFVYSIANFPTFRCAEQIRNDIDYHQLPVTVVSVGGGLAYGSLGYSHHAIQDYSLMRCMPNMLIAAPGDPMEVRSCVRYLISHPQPSYLRLGKSGEKSFHKTEPEVRPGKWVKIKEGCSPHTCLSTGAALETTIEIVELPKNRDWSIHSMPLWSMNVKDLQKEQLAGYEKVCTFEDHLLDGGFGSWLLESMSGHAGYLEKIRINGLNSKICGIVGSQKILNKLGGLSREIGELNLLWRK